MTMLAAGYQTILQPLSVVVHAEGASITSDAKEKLLARNKKLFQEKHKKIMDLFCPDYHFDDCKAFSRIQAETYSSYAREPTRVLVLDQTVPHKRYGVNSYRTGEVIKHLLSLGYKVSFHFEKYNVGQDVVPVDSVMSLLGDGAYVYPIGSIAKMAGRIKESKIPVANCPWKSVYVPNKDSMKEALENIRVICPNVHIVYETESTSVATNSSIVRALKEKYTHPVNIKLDSRECPGIRNKLPTACGQCFYCHENPSFGWPFG